jgi:uncharacterized protein
MADTQHLQQKLDELQKDYSKTKYNKATNKYLGLLRAKMARIKKAMSEKKGGGGVGFAVKKTGDATIVLVGFPNAGKSSLLTSITNAESRVAAYAFTTLEVIPGTLTYNGAKIQILDLPGLVEGAHEGRGGGTKIASVIRISDLLLFIVDINTPDLLHKLVEELDGLDIRANKDRPRIRIERKSTGGIVIDSNNHNVPDKKNMADVLNEFSVYNANIIFYEDADLNDLVDVLSDNVVYIKGVVVLNKVDSVSADYANKVRDEIGRITGMKVINISVLQNVNLDLLKETLFRALQLNRIYLKPRDGPADYENPMILRSGSTVMDVARHVHSKTAKNVRYAHITGKSAKFAGQKVGIEHVVQDEDEVTLIYSK